MSDVLYLLTTVFYHPLLFTLCLGLLLLPLPIFTYRVLVIEKLVPRNVLPPVQWPFRLWRLHLSTIPQPQLPRRLQFRRVDNIIKLAIMLWFTTIATLLRATFLWVLLWVQLTIFLPPFLLVNWYWVREVDDRFLVGDGGHWVCDGACVSTYLALCPSGDCADALLRALPHRGRRPLRHQGKAFDHIMVENTEGLRIYK